MITTKSGVGRTVLWIGGVIGFGVAGWLLWMRGNLSPDLVVSALNFRLLVVVAIVLISVAFRAIRLQIMAAAHKEVLPFSAGVQITLIGDLAAGISPGGAAGEPTRWLALCRGGIAGKRAVAILAGEFFLDLLILLFFLPVVFISVLYPTFSPFSDPQSWQPVLGQAGVFLVCLFLLVLVIFRNFRAFVDSIENLLNRLPIATPFLGKRKDRIVQGTNRFLWDFHEWVHRCVRYEKGKFAYAWLMGLGHAIFRLATLPLVAWSLDATVPLYPLILLECIVYYGLVFVPLPSGGGITESVSLLYLHSYSADASLLLIFWRFFDCYLLLGLGGLALLFASKHGYRSTLPGLSLSD